jgi:hypothetical protein
MSNRRKIGKVHRKVSCAICGGNAVREPSLLPDGRNVCRRCRSEGRLMQRLPCGHLGVPGTIVITDSHEKNFQCAQCSPHSVYSRGRT